MNQNLTGDSAGTAARVPAEVRYANINSPCTYFITKNVFDNASGDGPVQERYNWQFSCRCVAKLKLYFRISIENKTTNVTWRGKVAL